MPNLFCFCGNKIDLSPIPCPDEKMLIGVEDYDDVMEALQNQDARKAEDLLENKVQSVIICDSCGRYFLSKGPGSPEYHVLIPDPES